MYSNEPIVDACRTGPEPCNSPARAGAAARPYLRHLSALGHIHLSEIESGVEIHTDNHPGKPEPHNTFELAWNYAQDGKLAVDQDLAIVLDASPSFTNMIGYTREELIGMEAKYLHPKSEYEQVLSGFERDSSRAAIFTGLHLLRKDGSLLPVQIWASESLIFDGRSVSVVEFRDITEELQKENQLAAQNWALSAFSGAALALSQAENETELLQAICEAITKQSPYVLAFVSVAVDDEEKHVRFAASSGSAIGYLDGLQICWAEGSPNGQGPSGFCIRSGRNHIVDDLETEPNFERWRGRAKRYGIRSVAGIPLSIEGGWKGALVVMSVESGAFHDEPVQVFERLGEQIVHGIGALRHREQLEAERRNLEVARRHLTEVLGATVDAMVKAMEMRDPYTAGHEGRVAEISVAIGREMGWDESRLLGIRLAAMVHDIGKIAIPAEILTRPGRLNEAEYMLVKAHAETGYNILKDVPFMWPVATIVKQHHERQDGSGYPLGIHGDSILLESRVLAVADMVEAMASDRPYRRAWGLEYALRQVESEAGTSLDAEVVRICSALFREKRLVVAGLDWN